MNRKIGLLMSAMGALGVSASPLFRDAPRVICSDCEGTDKTGCRCEHKVAAKAKAQAKRDRKNAARLAEVRRGTLLAVGA